MWIRKSIFLSFACDNDNNVLMVFLSETLQHVVSSFLILSPSAFFSMQNVSDFISFVHWESRHDFIYFVQKWFVSSTGTVFIHLHYWMHKL